MLLLYARLSAEGKDKFSRILRGRCGRFPALTADTRGKKLGRLAVPMSLQRSTTSASCTTFLCALVAQKRLSPLIWPSKGYTYAYSREGKITTKK